MFCHNIIVMVFIHKWGCFNIGRGGGEEEEARARDNLCIIQVNTRVHRKELGACVVYLLPPSRFHFSDKFVQCHTSYRGNHFLNYSFF